LGFKGCLCHNIGRNCYDAEKFEPVAFAKVSCAEFEGRNEGKAEHYCHF